MDIEALQETFLKTVEDADSTPEEVMAEFMKMTFLSKSNYPCHTNWLITWDRYQTISIGPEPDHNVH